MQNLWSRAVQAKCTCRCPSCLSNATPAVSRRATTAAARRRVRYGEVFTFFYSSILATAAVVDSKNKDERNKEWDSVIGEAKDQLRKIEIDQTRRIQALSTASRSRSVKGLSSPDHRCQDLSRSSRHNYEQTTQGFEPPGLEPRSRISVPRHDENVETVFREGLVRRMKSISSKQTSTDEMVAMESRIRLKESGPRSHTPGVVEYGSDESFPGEELAKSAKGVPAEQVWRNALSGYRDLLSTKKLKTLEVSVSKMIFRLLLRSADYPTNGSVQLDPSEYLLRQQSTRDREKLEQTVLQMDDRLNQLKRTHKDCRSLLEIQSPLYPRYPQESLFEHRRSSLLNTKIRTILASSCGEDNDINALMTKICYALMLSSVPPDVHTYNMLMESLCGYEQTELAAVVLDSMFESNIRPNEVTAAAVLRYYTLANDYWGFTTYVRLMEGRGNGLARESSLQEFDEATHVMKRVYKKRYIKPSDFSTIQIGTEVETIVINKILPNNEVMQELIQGTLKFLGIREAWKQYTTVTKKGWDCYAKVLSTMLEYCSIREDWRHGENIWREMKFQCCPLTNADYFWILRLCLSHQRESVFREVLQLGIDRGDFDTTMSAMPLSAKMGDLKYLFEQDVNEKVTFVTSQVTMVGRILDAITSRIQALSKMIFDVEASWSFAKFRSSFKGLILDNNCLAQEIHQFERSMSIDLLERKLAVSMPVIQIFEETFHGIKTSWLFAQALQRLEEITYAIYTIQQAVYEFEVSRVQETFDQLTFVNQTLEEAITDIYFSRSLAQVQRTMAQIVSTNGTIKKAVTEIELSRLQVQVRQRLNNARKEVASNSIPSNARKANIVANSETQENSQHQPSTPANQFGVRIRRIRWFVKPVQLQHHKSHPIATP